MHIVIADRGWIIEQMASKLASELPYVDYDITENPAAYVQYYMTYAKFRQRCSTVEMGLFTHVEDFVPAATDRFFKIASQLDICICMSKKYANSLKKHTQSQIKIIPPGIDLNQYSANIRVGVVGRTYWTGRKGEEVVAKLISCPNVDWYFTGNGWPHPSISLTDEQMPNFYRQMDYILVPAYYEGGPMCVPEALAAGTKVIAPDVGWCKDFPCIFYEVGNWQQLSGILSSLATERLELRESVSDYSWDNFVEKHDRLFRQIFSEAEIIIGDSVYKAPPAKFTLSNSPLGKSHSPVVGLLMHGEKKSGGGPSTRIPKLVEKLRERNFEAFTLGVDNIAAIRDIQVLHIFNSWPPNRVKELVLNFKQNKPETKIILSPIYLDLAHHWLWNDWLRNYVVNNYYLELDQYKECFNTLAKFEVSQTRWLHQPQRHYLDNLQWCMSNVDYLICLSQCEKERLRRDFSNLPPIEIIPNVTVNNSEIEQQILDESYQIEGEFILVIGRIEARKNQLSLALALHGSNIKLVTIGKSHDEEYESVIASILGDNYHPLGRIDEKAVINKLCRQARAVCFMSWTEGMSLALIETVISGANRIITTSRNGEQEYLGDFVEYVNPWDIDSIKTLIDSKADTTNALQVDEKIIKNLTDWDAHTENTAQLYQKVIQ